MNFKYKKRRHLPGRNLNVAGARQKQNANTANYLLYQYYIQLKQKSQVFCFLILTKIIYFTVENVAFCKSESAEMP